LVRALAPKIFIVTYYLYYKYVASARLILSLSEILHLSIPRA